MDRGRNIIPNKKPTHHPNKLFEPRESQIGFRTNSIPFKITNMLSRLWRHLVNLEPENMAVQTLEPENTALEAILVSRETQTIDRPPRATRTSVVLTLPRCHRCCGNMTIRRNTETGEFFLGCSRFPRCCSTRNIIITHA